MEGHDPSAVAAGGDGSTAAPAVAAPLLPPRAPPRRLSSTPLGSYVSEPPSTLAMMRTYAQDLLSHQGEEVQQQAVPAGEIPAAWRGSGAPASGGAIELPPVSLVGKGPLERPTHFQLGPTISTPRRRTAPAEAGCPGGDASSPAYAKLRSSIGWVTSNSPGSAGNEVVLEHRVAGDLIISSATARAAAGRSPAHDPLRRRPILRASAGSGDDMDSLDFEGRQKPWYKKKKFWLIAGPLLVSFAFILAGVLYLVYNEDQRVGEFQMWRLCFFFAGLPIIWWIGRGSMDLAVWGVERTMFTWQNALYYAYAVRKPMANVIRAGLTTGWWALIMTALSGDMNDTLVTWYNNVLKVLGCLTLFMTANLLKVGFAKMVASKFNQQAHYQKMHDALKREYLLHLMLQPRQRYTEFEELAEAEAAGCEGEDDLGRSESAPANIHHHSPMKQNTLVRLFRRSSKPSERHQHSAEVDRTSSRTLKDRVMFWRASQADLHAIDEGEEEEEQQGGGGSQGSLPPGAVAVDMTNGGRSVGQEEPLLDHPEHPLPHPLPARAASAGGGTPAGSVPPSPVKHGSPAKPPPSPLSKLVRHRSDALEAAGVEAGGLTPRATALPLPDCGGAAGSREPSVAGGRAFVRAPRLSVQRAASITSMRSARSRAAADAVPPPKKALLAHASSMSSSSSAKAMMALRMSKMVTFKDTLSRTERSEQVTTELEAKKLGFYLFHNLKADYDRHGVGDYIVLDDLEQFLSEKDAKAGMDMLDEDDNGQVNVQECCGAITRVFVDRRNLAASLKDARTIVGTLETLIGIFLHILMGFIYLLIWDVDVLKTWAGFASLFLGFSFIFGNSIRTTYENVVFLFMVHPYDVGDSIFIDNDQTKVEEIHLSFTVLTSSNNQRVWYPNEKIRVIPFINISTSGNRGEAFKVLVDLDTAPGVIEELRSAAEACIRANPKDFSGTLSVNLNTATAPLKMTISVYWEYAHSGADGGRLGRNRTKMYTALSEAMTRSGCRYTWPATADMRPVPLAVGAGGDAAGLDPAAKLL
ncbi:hypothetical protein CHLNCDRAFT_57189 [Chlorella variabilis]|uniref:EF-hand domain-containing protein n=1 Tax=Chlorella variabilis TaxID=554065 RepID=E1Z8N3_CHLVA|nr:hypothetical protein CHLNCDRAFT_57189 [Chlorella variabilis]EFN57637.1 hypothetical protein CHLNCDRAFT_57189 [Chlorella variabilis]|eukprot:XP_005849739.1 hypothetical protein CHLNCDRAFT_57189 [Chlorella variabilis]